uniref:Uncharacterized protein n=1 Tax=Sphaerodactylus townsendi TaxID=933632 RepID=A0ACB8EXJ1_9SAUR
MVPPAEQVVWLGNGDFASSMICLEFVFFTLDGSSDPLQQSYNASDSDEESIFNQSRPPLSQVVPQIMNLSRWEDREANYQEHLYDMEQELTMALRKEEALSRQLYEIGRLAFPGMRRCDSTSTRSAQKVKDYLERLVLEKNQLEKRAQRAERTLWETECEVYVLEKCLQNYRSTHHVEPSLMPDDPPPAYPTQSFRSFFSKMHKKSPEEKAAARSPEKRAKESIDEVSPRKQSSGKGALAKVSRRSPSKPGSSEAKYLSRGSSVFHVNRDVFTDQKVPKDRDYSGDYSEAAFCWPTPEPPRSSRASAGYNDSCVALVHRHLDTHPEREQEDLARDAEVDHLNDLGTASTLPKATPSCGRGQNIKIFSESSVSLNLGPAMQMTKLENCKAWSKMQHLAIMEGNGEIRRQGEGVTSKEDGVTSGSISLKPVALVGQIFKTSSDAQTNSQKLDDVEDPTSNATLQTEISLPRKDYLKSGESQSVNIVHSSDQLADGEPRTSPALLTGQASCSLDPLQKPGDLSSQELSLKADSPSNVIKCVEKNYLLGEKKVLEDTPGFNNKVDEPILMEEMPTVAPQLNPEDPLPSGLNEGLTSLSSESPQPTSLTEASPSSVAEETAVEES